MKQSNEIIANINYYVFTCLGILIIRWQSRQDTAKITQIDTDSYRDKCFPR